MNTNQTIHRRDAETRRQIKTRSSFQFDFCFQDPGSKEVIGFEIDFYWREILSGPEERTGRSERQSVLRAESNFILDDQDGFDFAPIFSLNYKKACTQIELRNKRDRLRLPIASHGSGGNWYWETITIPARRQPHLMNWLRRQKGWGPMEWDNEFMNTVWRKRGTIQLIDLRMIGRSIVREFMKQEAA